jgi:hypothetical protein
MSGPAPDATPGAGELDGLAITALVLGILSIVVPFFPFAHLYAFVAWLLLFLLATPVMAVGCTILGMVAAAMGLLSVLRGPPRRLAFAGLAAGLAGTVTSVLVMLNFAPLLKYFSEA